MNCPICGKPASLKSVVRPATTAAGIGAGGYVAASGASTGAAVGSLLGPVGTLAGGCSASFWALLPEELPVTRSVNTSTRA